MVDDVVQAFAEHIGRSSVDYSKFQNVQRVFCQTNLEAQGIHDVRWLSRGEAVQRLLNVLPAAIVVMKEYKKELYEVVTSLKFHWLIRFLADVLSPGHNFGSGEKMRLPDFIKAHQKLENREMKVEGIDGDGNPVSFVFTLHERPLPDHETDGDVTACVELLLKFIRIVDAELEWRMRDLNLLEGAKLFRTASYVPDDTKWLESFRKWLGQLDKLAPHPTYCCSTNISHSNPYLRA
ncbi:unnamed protein product [Closterium sp. Naga37s-1]|nr:unnamed protein product [Closterium sp. Naga37s-1]